MNESSERFGFECAAARILSDNDLELLAEIARQRVSRRPNRVLVSSLSSAKPRTFKLPISGRKMTCPPNVLISIVMDEIEYRRRVDAEWDEDVFDGKHRDICILRVAEG